MSIISRFNWRLNSFNREITPSIEASRLWIHKFMNKFCNALSLSFYVLNFIFIYVVAIMLIALFYSLTYLYSDPYWARSLFFSHVFQVIHHELHSSASACSILSFWGSSFPYTRGIGYGTPMAIHFVLSLNFLYL